MQRELGNKNAHKILVGKPERKASLEICRSKWKDSINANIKE
jgi:hypothetical protein